MGLDDNGVVEQLQNLILRLEGADEFTVAVAEKFNRKDFSAGPFNASFNDGLRAFPQLFMHIEQVKELVIDVYVLVAAGILKDRYVFALLSLPNYSLFPDQALRRRLIRLF